VSQLEETSGSEPVSDDEILYRRVSLKAGFYDPERSPSLSHAAFTPNRNDIEGLSLVRAKYASVEEAAVGNPEALYFVAVLRTADLRREGMEIVPDPQRGQPGHALITNLRFGNVRTPECKHWAKTLAHNFCLRIEGPFPREPKP